MADQNGKMDTTVSAEHPKARSLFSMWPVVLVTNLFASLKTEASAKVMQVFGLKENLNMLSIKQRIVELVLFYYEASKTKISTSFGSLKANVSSRLESSVKLVKEYASLEALRNLPNRKYEELSEHLKLRVAAYKTAIYGLIGKYVSIVRENASLGVIKGKAVTFATPYYTSAVDKVTSYRQVAYSKAEEYLLVVRENASLPVLKEKAINSTTSLYAAGKEKITNEAQKYYTIVKEFVTSEDVKNRVVSLAIAGFRMGKELVFKYTSAAREYTANLLRTTFVMIITQVEGKLNENKTTAMLLDYAKTKFASLMIFTRNAMSRLPMAKPVADVATPVTPQ